jgi:hypothetical protein
LEREKEGRLAEVPWHPLTCRLHRLLLGVPILPLLLPLRLQRQPFHSQERGPGRAKEGADRLGGDLERIARGNLREGSASRGSSAQGSNAAAVEKRQTRAGPLWTDTLGRTSVACRGVRLQSQ